MIQYNTFLIIFLIIITVVSISVCLGYYFHKAVGPKDTIFTPLKSIVPKRNNETESEDDVIQQMSTMMATNENRDTFITKTGEIIPAVIIQTYKTNEIPFRMKQAAESIKQINNEKNDIEYLFFSDNTCEGFLKKNIDHIFPGASAAFSHILPGAYKADIFRLGAIFHYGGIYLDTGFNYLESRTDYITFHSLISKYMESSLEIPMEKEGIEGLHQAMIISSKNHPFIKYSLEKTIQRILESKDPVAGVDDLKIAGGPVAMMEFFKEYYPNTDPAKMFKTKFSSSIFDLALADKHIVLASDTKSVVIDTKYKGWFEDRGGSNSRYSAALKSKETTYNQYIHPNMKNRLSHVLSKKIEFRRRYIKILSTEQQSIVQNIHSEYFEQITVPSPENPSLFGNSKFVYSTKEYDEFLLEKLLIPNCVVFMKTSTQFGETYLLESLLKPYVHFIPVEESSPELLEKALEWAVENKNVCKSISARANLYASAFKSTSVAEEQVYNSKILI